MNLVNFAQILVACFCTVDQSGHDYQVISFMHINHLIVEVRFWLRLIFFVPSPFLSFFLSSFPALLLSFSFSIFLELYSPIYVSIRLGCSEQPQRRYISHKTLWPCEVFANFEIYSRRFYRCCAKESTIVNVIARQSFSLALSRGKVNLLSGSASSSKYRHDSNNGCDLQARRNR